MPNWMLPLAYVVVSATAAFALPRLEHALLPVYATELSAASALAVLSTIASGMMGLTAIVFSIAFVLVQFSAVTYSPRIALRFVRDPAVFHALGVFFATFTYALATAAWVDRAGSGKVPLVSWLVAAALLFASLIVFSLLVQRLNDLQVTNMLRSLGDSGRRVIAQTFAAGPVTGAPPLPLPPAAPVTQVLRHVGPPRYIERFDTAPLAALAERAGGTIVLACAVGDTVGEESVLLRLHGGAPQDETALRQAIHLGLDRTFEQDPKYPLRLLVDIAIKALSPAINDPTTAVQALDQIEDLLRRLARVPLEIGSVTDAAGVLRLRFPMPSWDDYLSLAFDEIRMFGETSVQVMRRLRAALLGLLEILGEAPRAAAVRDYLAHMDAMIEASHFDRLDKQSASQRDPQGLGLARDQAG